MRKHNRPKLFTIYKKETLTMGVSFLFSIAILSSLYNYSFCVL